MPTITVQEQLPASAVTDFEEIYREYAPVVYRTAWGVLGSRADAEDILQTVFMRLFRQGFSPEFHKNPKGYLYRAAVNTCLDVLKARRRRPMLVLEDAGRTELTESFADSKFAFDEELYERLYAAIAQLSTEAAEVVLLRYMHGKSQAEIAKSLGVSRTVVAVRLFRARARLKRLVQIDAGGK